MFVNRNAQGQIVSISAVEDERHQEPVSLPNAEIDAFMANDKPEVDALKASDYELIRVIEDLIDLLSASGTIRFTDLPLEARRKLLERKSIRSGRSGFTLLNDDDVI